MQLGLSTVFAQNRALGPDAIVDVLLRSGAAFVVLDAGVPKGLLDELCPRLLLRRDELPVRVVENVCPASRRAVAQLCALDDDEADAAIAAAIETIRIAGSLGAAHVLVRLGEVKSLRARWPFLRGEYLRGELNESPEEIDAIVVERIARGRPHLDRARRALDRLVRACESQGVTLGVRNPSRYLGLPLPVELRPILDDLRGAPLAPALDVAALHLGEAMGLVALDAALDAWQHAPAILVADACAQITGLVPGQGELPLARIVERVASEAVCAFHPAAILDEPELFAGMDAGRKLLAEKSPATEKSDLVDGRRPR